MTLKIFADVLSQPSRAVLIFCRASGIQHEFVPIKISNMDNKTPEYTKLNPLQTVPSAEIDGKPLVESLAIMRFLVNTKPVDDHWYPKEVWRRLKVDEYLDWQHNNTRMSCAMYFQTRWAIPIMKQEPPNEKQVQNFKTRMEKTLDQIEQIWLDNGNHAFIGGIGDKPSVADIWACCELEQPSMAGYDVRQGRPVLEAYMKRVEGYLNPHYDETHSVVYKLVKKFGGKIPGVDFVESKL